MRILLDTCTFLWLAADAPELSPAARRAFVQQSNEVYLSAASAWEITVKHALGRLPLPRPPDRFVPEMRERHEIAALDIDEAAALHLAKLPPLHRDPFDRMLVSQALLHGLTLLTPDETIARYAAPTYW